MALVAKDETRGGVSSHKARAATALVQGAVLAGCRGIAVGSCGNYGQAVATACRLAGLEATVVLPTSYDVDDQPIRAAGAMVIRAGATYEDAVTVSRHMATHSGFTDGNVDASLSEYVRESLARIALELRLALPRPPSGIWIPMGNGTTVAAVGGMVLDLGWPTRVYGVSSSGNNSILASWPGRVHVPLLAASLLPSRVSEPLANWNALHGDEALDVLHETGGAAVGVNDLELLLTQMALRGATGLITRSTAGVAGLAGARRHVGRLGQAGTHVAVLTG
jgi:threonine synthase